MKRLVKSYLPTKFGNFHIIAYGQSEEDPMPHLALVHKDKSGASDPTMVRIHSECLTGDIFGSKRCDCGAQLHKSLELADEHGGVVIYLRQEGRGIGLVHKLHAYNAQDEGMNTAEANTHLGFEVDARQYNDAIYILKDLGIKQIHLMTNNPEKIDAFDDSGIEIVTRVPLIIEPGKENLKYLETKKSQMGHLL